MVLEYTHVRERIVKERSEQAELDKAWLWIGELFDILASKSDSTSNGASADLNILSQVTPSSLRPKDLRDYTWLIQYAMSNGALPVSPVSGHWKIEGDCSNPFVKTFSASLKLDWLGRDLVHGRRMYLDIHTRCRKCDRCRKHKARLWRIRALSEYRRAYRTWFGTWTLSPADLFTFKCRAIAKCKRKGQTWERLSENDRFAATHKEISVAITLALKRFRKRVGLTRDSFSYLIVAEAHKSGEPHYHCLFHECNLSKRILYADLRTFWPHGFSRWKLNADTQNPAYLCKYLAKDVRARVRASTAYGARIDTLGVNDYDVSRLTTTMTPHRKRPQF